MSDIGDPKDNRYLPGQGYTRMEGGTGTTTADMKERVADQMDSGTVDESNPGLYEYTKNSLHAWAEGHGLADPKKGQEMRDRDIPPHDVDPRDVFGPLQPGSSRSVNELKGDPTGENLGGSTGTGGYGGNVDGITAYPSDYGPEGMGGRRYVGTQGMVGGIGPKASAQLHEWGDKAREMMHEVGATFGLTGHPADAAGGMEGPDMGSGNADPSDELIEQTGLFL